MPDYSQGLIYKIMCKDSSVREMYIGSSTDSYRKSKHKSACNKENKKNNLKLYKFIRAHGGWDNWKLVELYKYPCNSKPELEQEECWVWDKYSCYYDMLNDRKPYQTEEERRAYLKQKFKERYDANIERERTGANKRYHAKKEELNTPTPCDCGLMINKQNITKHKKTEIHKKRMTALAAGIVIDDTPKTKKKECECGAVVSNLNRHKKDSCRLRYSSA
tara:strand:+ start:85 stop:741 length:657 start_codon:yes stop_codon:yes gene_type:complete